MPFKSYKDESRKNYGVSGVPEGSGLTVEQINAGALMRIADATELMAKDRIRMEADLAYYKRRKADLDKQLATERKRSAALRGVIGRMKAKK